MALATFAQLSQAAATPFLGEWEGAIEVPGAQLGILVRIQQGADGKLSGSADIPVQNATGLQLVQFNTDGNSISFAFAAIPATFQGQLSDDGRTLAGTFLQSGVKMPFKLVRKDNQAKPDPLAGFGDFLQTAMKDFNVPGLAIAILKDGKVIFSEGYGLRDVDRKLPVTQDTVFQIGSATKAFTATTFELLSQEGQLDWNKPVREYIPGYRLWDDVATAHITPLDWATHRSGLPRHDLLWIFNPGLDATQTINNARYLEPSQEFRATWQYNNLGYVTLGYIISQVTGKPWSQVVQERILDPLGMKDTTFDIDRLKASNNAALPYAQKAGTVYQVPLLAIGAAAPAGARPVGEPGARRRARGPRGRCRRLHPEVRDRPGAARRGARRRQRPDHGAIT
jgi:CubicO group peptidase (beta-lactamase class C family)